MIDWEHNQQILGVETKRELESLFAENRKRGDTLVAIGYVFEFGRGQLEFDLCANTKRNADRSIADYLSKHPNGSAVDMRWNSGDFDYPGVNSEFSDEWWDELTRLDEFANDSQNSQEVYDGVVDICSSVLVECALEGVIPDWTNIDFNVAELLDDIETIMERDQQIRSMIKRGIA